MKSIKRAQPPPQPAGYSRCSTDTLQRWMADEYRFPPYQYRGEFVIWQQNKWRLLNSRERETLHGFGARHTELCWNANQIKQNPSGYEDEKASLVGDSFSVYSFVYFAAQACRKFIPQVSYSQLVQRMGLAPGLTMDYSHLAPLSRAPCYGPGDTPQAQVNDLRRCLLRRVNHTGSDIRICSGVILNPKAYPRQSVCSDWWKWRPLFAYRWQRRDHINTLELKSITHAVQWRIRHLKEQGARVFHITDSYVCVSIIGKGRSSSRMLNRVLQELNAWLLTFNVYLLVLHVESTDNPTDEQSRVGGAKNSR